MRKISVLYIKKNVLVRGRTQFAPTRFVHHGLVCGKSDRARVAEVSDPYDWCAPTELVHRRWLGAELRGRARRPAPTRLAIRRWVGVKFIRARACVRIFFIPAYSAKKRIVPLLGTMRFSCVYEMPRVYFFTVVFLVAVFFAAGFALSAGNADLVCQISRA